MKLPTYLEVRPDCFKSVLDCDYVDVVAAREREADPERREQLSALLRVNGEVWCMFPGMTVGNMTT